MAKDRKWEVRSAVAGNRATPPTALELLAADHDQGVYVLPGSLRASVACNPSAPSELLRRLAADEHESVRRGVAGNPSTPWDLLRRLAADEHESVRRGVAGNPSTPGEVLTRLAEERAAAEARPSSVRAMPSVRSAVAGNPSTPQDTLRTFLADQWSTLEALAGNPSAPADVLAVLAEHEHVLVRDAASQNPALPAGTESAQRRMMRAECSMDPRELESLSADPHVEVRRRVAANPLAPPHILQHLAKDDDASAEFPSTCVRHEVAANPSTPADALTLLADSEDARLRRLLARNPTTPQTVLARLAVDRDFDVRFDAEHNSSTFVGLPSLEQRLQLARTTSDSELLDRMACDAHHAVRLAVAENAHAPSSVLLALADDVDERVRVAALGNANAGSDAIERGASHLMEDDEFWVAPLDATELSLLLARNPHTPPDVLSRLVACFDGADRGGWNGELLESLACNPSTPTELVMRLCEGHADIRRAVADHSTGR